MTAAKEFDQFVKQMKKENETSSPVDWNKRKDDWLGALTRLYSTVEDYLSKYTPDRSIRIDYEDVNIIEERLGSYSARKMMLTLGKSIVELAPVGTVIFGAYGRVNIQGASARLRLVLVEPTVDQVRLGIRVLQPREQLTRSEPIDFGNLVWKVASDPPNVRLYDLTKENLFEAIMNVAAT